MIDSRIQIVHVLNKNTLGGAESLVNSLLVSQEFNNHQVFYLANSNISKFLLSKSRLRILVFLKAAIILIIKIIGNSKNRKIFIFHLAECHLIFHIIGNLLPVKKMQTVFIGYIHQSPGLYPNKLKKHVKFSTLKADGIIYYSSQVKRAWEIDILNGINYRSTVIHNFVSNQFQNKRNLIDLNGKNYYQAIFIGRNVTWKRPKLAYELAKEMANKGIKINLNFLGISQSEGELFIDKNLSPNLKVVFYGKVQNSLPLLLKSDIMFYIADQEICEEGVGVAAMEALELGIPVVISNKYKSDFSNLELLIDLKNFTDNIKNFDLDRLKEYLKFLSERENTKFASPVLFSRDNYNKKLLHFTSEILSEKVKKL